MLLNMQLHALELDIHCEIKMVLMYYIAARTCEWVRQMSAWCNATLVRGIWGIWVHLDKINRSLYYIRPAKSNHYHFPLDSFKLDEMIKKKDLILRSDLSQFNLVIAKSDMKGGFVWYYVQNPESKHQKLPAN